eukprot:6859863-Ditylum_brightwellii.AAC.1
MKFITGSYIDDARATTLDKAITHVDQAFAKREDEHVGDIERLIRTMQERVQSVHTTLPMKECLGE